MFLIVTLFPFLFQFQFRYLYRLSFLQRRIATDTVICLNIAFHIGTKDTTRYTLQCLSGLHLHGLVKTYDSIGSSTDTRVHLLILVRSSLLGLCHRLYRLRFCLYGFRCGSNRRILLFYCFLDRSVGKFHLGGVNNRRCDGCGIILR